MPAMEAAMISMILSHWVSYLLLFTMIVIVVGIQWLRKNPESAPIR